MVMLIAPTGRHAGHPIWSCSTYPMCRGVIAVVDDVPRGETQPSLVGRASRTRRTWLLAVGLMLAAIILLYLLGPPFFASG
jgi:hypothetical protein